MTEGTYNIEYLRIRYKFFSITLFTENSCSTMLQMQSSSTMALYELSESLSFCAILNMEAKSSSQMRYFWRFFYPMFVNCVHATSASLFTLLNVKLFFWPNCSKFAVECDWNSKNSQNVQNLGFFWKIDGFFLEFFFTIDNGGKFTVECVSNGII